MVYCPIRICYHPRLVEVRSGHQRLSLHRLELIGFKSFAERTELTFSPGISAIVGPNGCGKSNIADCIAWVLGEQSARSLRGEKMEDVIFNGTENRGPQGMAQVSLTLRTGLADQKEIVVGRRLFRDGESQYFLNGSSCRLRDIQDVIFDTGMGTRSYFLIEQGRIGQILQSKPVDRRLLIEEAAGISKYRAKKHAAELKLESSRANLERVRDIIDEVRKQMNSLKRQAALARRFERLSAEAKKLQKMLLTFQLRSLQAEMAEAEAAYQQARDAEVALAARLSAEELEVERGDIELTNADKSVESLRQAVFDAQLTIQKDESEIARIKQQRENHAMLLEQNQRRAAALGEKSEKLAASLASRSAELEEIEVEIRSAENALEEAIERQKRAESVTVALADEARQRRLSQRETAAREASTKNELIDISSERSRLEGLEARLRQEQERLTARITETSQRIEQAREELAAREATLSDLTMITDGLAADESQETAHLADVESRLAELDRKRTQTASRLEAIQAIEEGRALVPPNVRAVLSRHSDEVSALGVVSDFLEVTDLSLVWCVENCLRAVLSGVVVGTVEDVRRATQSVKEPGAVTYVPMELLAAPWPDESPLPGPRLLDVIRVDPRYPQLSALLGDVLLAETLDEAVRMRATSRGRAIYAVRQDGTCLLPSGAIIAGNPGRNEESILWIKAESRRLEGELSAVLEGIQPLSVEAEDSRKRIERLRARLGEVRGQCTEHEKEILLERQRLSQLDADRQDALEHSAIVTREIEHATGEHEQVLRRQQQLVADLSQIDAELARLAGEIEDSDAKIAVDQESRSSLREAVMRCESSRNALADRRSTHLTDRARIESELRDVRDELDACSNEMQTHGLQIAQLDARRAELEVRIAERIHDHQEKEAVLREKEQALGTIREANARRHEEVKGLRTVHQEAMETRSRAELVRAEQGRDIAHIRQTCLDEFHTAPEEIAAEVEREPLPLPKAAARPPEEGVEEVPEAPVDLKQVIGEELEKKRADLDRMGAINLRAMEDYEQTLQRYEFLTAQEKDLLASIEATISAIRQMDEESRELFKEAFERINASFGEVFRTLFGGGRAELRLMEGEDVLECGIEVNAQPPGKKVTMLLSLSGGEKALTAIALLFAIFQYKPSPFCLLDEVDAPLDESNTDRFLRILEAYSHRTQFIIVTHNVKTMQAAATLYGITMQEKGVSKVVSVRVAEPEPLETVAQPVS